MFQDTGGSDYESPYFYVNSQVAVGATEDSKTINDPIWGYNITIEPMLTRIVDTPHFQRLRDLKQLGTTYMVFPGASHNRFEHSLGTCHLAGQMLINLRVRQPELNITDREVLLVKMAGLCHDMGHGPFSHVFDNVFIPRAAARLGKTIKWKHEDASEMMLDAAIKDAQLDDPEFFDDYLTREEITFVKELINPERYPVKSRPARAFLYDIVSNSRCSVDVDKFDYLLRDSYNVGVKVSFDPRRLIRNCRVVEGQICFQSKDVFLLYELFLSRYSMFKQVYSHRVAKAIEFMISDILLLAEDHFKFTECIDSPEKYLRLTDCILRDIENSTVPDLAPARDLIGKLRRRQLYKLAGEAIIPIPPKSESTASSSSKTAVATAKAATEADILRYKPFDSTLCADDIVVHNMTLNFAMKDKNPVDNILFYKDSNPDKAYKIPQFNVSMLTPAHFQEKYVRVFVKDPSKMAEASSALNSYMEQVHNAPLLQADVEETHILSQQSTRATSPRKARLVSRVNTMHLAETSSVSLSAASVPGRQMYLPSTPVLPSNNDDCGSGNGSGLSKRGKSVSFRMDALDTVVEEKIAEAELESKTLGEANDEDLVVVSSNITKRTSSSILLDQELEDSFSQLSQVSQSGNVAGISASQLSQTGTGVSSQMEDGAVEEPAKKKKKGNNGGIMGFINKKT